MEKQYNPHTIESTWYQTWEKANYFCPQGNGPSYCIMLPPPNVTGSLHMGHGFQHTLMDALTRYHRMCGDKTLWQPGVDHAGIATQMVVERQLLAQGKSRHDVGREAFVEKIWEWKAKSGDMITQQMRRMGSSVDWSRERFTMDPDFSAAVQQVFIQLHKEGLVYRGQRLVNWDPVLHTAISDLEVVTNEEQGSLWYIRYPIMDSTEYLVVATTRPETLLGDVAVAVHPDDPRYQALIGQQVILPLTGRTIPIVADDMVETEFGTGCVKITPAHDFNDYLVGQRHQLPLLNIFTPNAILNTEQYVPAAYQGLDRYIAREKIVRDLQELGLLEKIEPYTAKIPRGDRSGAVIEPYLTWQWFIKAEPLAKPAIDAVEKGPIQFVPGNWIHTYLHWMNNIQDWCISRQLWWGHRIPAWYDEEGKIYVGENEAAIRTEHKLPDHVVLTQDSDVLDTWFSSALWPFATLGWPKNQDAVETFYPTNVLVTGFDIIFFWVARMIMMGLKFTGKIPFREIYITGLIRDAEGHKMSKSKGNVLDPIDLIDGITLDDLVAKRIQGLMQPKMAAQIEKNTRKQCPDGSPAFGTDALRFTFCALASTGRDIRFDLGRVEGYRNFCNKLWNAARYVLMNVGATCGRPDIGRPQVAPTETLGLADRWIRSRLQQTIQDAHEYFKNYRFDLLAQTLYDFTWNEFCDWYLELSKPTLTNPNADQQGTRYTLVDTLETLLRLMHPCMPYITEEIWQRVAPLLGNTGKTIMLEPYPSCPSGLPQLDNEAEDEITWLQNIILGIRNIRGEMNISPAKKLVILLRNGTLEDKQRLEDNKDYLISLAKLDSVRWLTDDERPPPAATALAGKIQILIPLAGLINVQAEQARLNKEIEKLNQELTRTQQKLDNPNYTDKAPIAVVEKDRMRVKQIQGAITQLTDQLSHIALI